MHTATLMSIASFTSYREGVPMEFSKARPQKVDTATAIYLNTTMPDAFTFEPELKTAKVSA